MELRRIAPGREVGHLRDFLLRATPEDYLLEDLTEWVHEGRLWVGQEDGAWVAFGRLHDLGEGDGWVSGIRVLPNRRGQGLGGQLLETIVADARSLGITTVRAVIEDRNAPSRRLFTRTGFQTVAELTLRRGLARKEVPAALKRVSPGQPFDGPVGWLPAGIDRVDVLPGSDGGRFGRWRTPLLDRWTTEGKLYVGPGLAAAVQTDWWREPRTLWVNPLQGGVSELFPALDRLAHDLQHVEWQAFLPSTEELRAEYDTRGALRHPAWGDRVFLYERHV